MIPFLIILVTLIIDLYTDLFKYWGKVNHKKGLILRLPSAIISGILNPLSIALWLTYWVVFDITIGIVKYNNWLALGTTSKLDLLQRRYPWLVPVKFVAGVGALALYVFFV